MTKPSLDDILSRLHELQAELESEIDRLLREKRELFHYTYEKGKVRFEQGIKVLQKHQKEGVWSYLLSSRMSHLVTAPVIYSLFIPFVLLDVMATLFQQICFRVYGIARVPRKEYFFIDHQHLAYLNLIEKINCVYCGYGNCLIEYMREIAARTEQYWCPIKHARCTPDPHRFVERFVDYGDADAYKTRLEELRKEITEMEEQSPEHPET